MAIFSAERLGLVLMGSTAALVIAYVVRFLPIATGSLSAGLARVVRGVANGLVSWAQRSQGADEDVTGQDSGVPGVFDGRRAAAQRALDP